MGADEISNSPNVDWAGPNTLVLASTERKEGKPKVMHFDAERGSHGLGIHVSDDSEASLL